MNARHTDTLQKLQRSFISMLSDPSLRALLSSPQALRLYEMLDSNLFLEFKKEPASIMLTSAENGEGRTTLSLLLAAYHAVHNPEDRVLLVDCDFNGRGASALLSGNSSPPGLLNYFYESDSSVDGCISKTGLENLDCVFAGRSEYAHRFSHQKFMTFFNAVRPRYQLVVADAPCAGANHDALAISKVVQNVLLVIRYGGPKREQIQKIISEFRHHGANVIGGVLNQRLFPVPKFLYRL